MLFNVIALFSGNLDEKGMSEFRHNRFRFLPWRDSVETSKRFDYVYFDFFFPNCDHELEFSYSEKELHKQFKANVLTEMSMTVNGEPGIKEAKTFIHLFIKELRNVIKTNDWSVFYYDYEKFKTKNNPVSITLEKIIIKELK